MMAFKRHLVAALLVIILGCLAGAGWLIYSNQRAQIESERGERHSRVVIQQLGDLLSSLKDAETGQRGFIITGKPDYLEPYQASLAKIAIGLADLRRLTADNPQQQQRLDAITPLVAAKLAELKQTIALRETQGFLAASAVVTTQAGKKIMDEIRALVAQAEAHEAQLLKERVAIHAADYRRTMQSVTLGSALGGLALLLLFIRLRWELTSRQRAETVARASEQRLRVATDAAELGIWTWQPEGDHISWENEKPYDIFCMPRTDAPLTAARFAAEFVHPEDLAAFERAIAATVQNGARLFFQGRFYCPDGALRWVEFTGQPVAGTKGSSLRVIGTVQDITGRKQAEEAQARLAKIVETSDDAIISKSIDGIIQTWNAGAERMFGYPAEEVVGKPITVLIPPERLPEEEKILQQLRRGKAVEQFETLRLTRDGRPIDVSLTISPLKNANGNVVGASMIVRNITERKQAGDALRESEQRFRALVLASSDLMCRMSPDWSEMRQVYDKNFVVETEEPNGNWLEHYVHRADQPRLMALVREAIRTKSLFEMEHRVRRADGSWGWMLSRAVPLLDAKGEIVEWFGTGSDVTEQKRAEQALRESEERFRALFDRGPIAIYSCDAAGIAQEFNPCAVQLWGREPKRGDNDERFSGSYKLYLPDGTFVPREQSPMAAVISGDSAGAYDQEFIIERPDGSRISIIANTVPLKNEQGQITGGMCCFYDITERNRLERKSLEQAQALADLDRRKDEFLAMLSHELRNPLAALANAVQLLRLQKSEAPLQQQARHVIERQLGQLTHLVDDLLEVSRITTGRVQLRQQQIALSGIVERAVETAQPLIDQRRHQLQVSLPLEPVFLLGDAARLEQVLVNLLTNAAKYTDEGGHIWLSAEVAKAAEVAANGAAVPMVVIRVRDTGIGIAPELLPRIFDLFTQADRALDRSQGGLGIGLCLVQRLVELHGGSVEAHSVLGQGSEFVVRLPLMLTALPASLALPSPALETAQPTTKGCRVLVVDDNVDATQSLAKLLELTGHEVRLAYDGPSALAAAIDYRPDVVLLDIGLPGLSGFEVAEQIRQQAALRHIVLVALTGYGQDTDRQLSHDAGFDYHLVKPARFSEIEKILLRVSERVT